MELKRTASWIAVAAVIAAVGVLAYLKMAAREEPPPAENRVTQAPAEPPPPVAAAPPIAHPLEAEPAAAADAKPLPELDASDAALVAELAGVIGPQTWDALFRPDMVIRRIVATVDALPRQVAPARMMPVKPAPGAFAVEGEGAARVIAPANAERYVRHVAAMQAASIPALVGIYVRFYPLFQRAYEELGYPGAYFNDRVFVAIDDLLAAPEPQPPVRLVQPKVLYEYADRALEARSAGQKIMMRLGRENGQKVRAALRELRGQLERRSNR